MIKLLFNTSHIKNNSTCATYFPTFPLSLYQIKETEYGYQSIE